MIYKFKDAVALLLLGALMCSCNNEENGIDGDEIMPILDPSDMVLTLDASGEERVINVLPNTWGFYAQLAAKDKPWTMHKVDLSSSKTWYNVVLKNDLDWNSVYMCPPDSRTLYAEEHPEVGYGHSPWLETWHTMEVTQQFEFADFTFCISCYRYIKISVGPNDTGADRSVYVYADFSGLCRNNGLEIHQPSR